MSQEKVDRYKEQKKNRHKIAKKEKMKSLMLKLAGTIVAIALVGWIGFSVYQVVVEGQSGTSKTYAIDTAAVDDYLNDMSSQVSAETEDTQEETEAAETEAAETEAAADSEASETDVTESETAVTEAAETDAAADITK